MPDFDEPEMILSDPYADGHKDLILAYTTGYNYNTSPIQVPAQTLFKHMGGHCILKRVFAQHVGTIGVTVQPAILPRGNAWEYFYLDPMVTTSANDPMLWAGLDLAIIPKKGVTTTMIAQFVMTGYAATDDLVLFMQLEWWP